MNSYNDHKLYDWRDLVETKNFQLSTLEESIINIQWENLRDQAPSKASIKLILEKLDQTINATWKVNNFDLSFEASGQSADLRDLLRSLATTLTGQMDEWKKGRFATLQATV